MTLQEFFFWEKASRDVIDVKKCYIDVADDLVSGVLLSQIVYWHLPDRNGESKLKVENGGRLWLVKKREDWWEECRIRPKAFDRAITQLEELSLVTTEIHRFGGVPQKFIRINEKCFLSKLESVLKEGIPDQEPSEKDLGTNPSENEPQEASGGKIDLPESGKSILPNREFQSSQNGKIDIPEKGKSTIQRLQAETTTETTTETTSEIKRSASVEADPKTLNPKNFLDEYHSHFVEKTTTKPNLDYAKETRIYKTKLKAYGLTHERVVAALKTFFEDPWQASQGFNLSYFWRQIQKYLLSADGIKFDSPGATPTMRGEYQKALQIFRKRDANKEEKSVAEEIALTFRGRK